MGDSAVVIRPAGDHDVAAVVLLNGFVQELHAHRRPDVFVRVNEMDCAADYFRGLLTVPDQAVFIAEVAGGIAGYVHAEAQRRPGNLFKHSDARAYVHQISVHPTHRRKGVGRALMAYVDVWANNLGLGAVALDSWTFNPAAQRFFESLGFTGYNVRLDRRL